VEAALFGEVGISMRNADEMAAASTAPISSTPLPNSNLALAVLQQHIVARLLALGSAFVSAASAQVDGVLADPGAAAEICHEAARTEELCLRAVRTSDARQLEQLQCQIVASKHAAREHRT